MWEIELSSRRFPSWYLGRHPDKQIIQAAHTSEFASDFGRDVRDIFSTEEYQNVFSTQLHPGSRAADRWQTTLGGRYFAVGVGGALVGRGAHLGLIDDPIRSWEDAHSQSFRDNLWRWYTSVFLTRLMPQAAVVVCLTHWHEDDLAGRIMQGDDTWEVLKLPALNDEGEALWPEWYDKDALMRWRSQATSLEWEALYMQNPQPETGIYFQREWFKRYDKTPDHLSIHITHDDAVTGGGGDFTEIGVWGIDENDNLYALDWWYGQTTMDVWIDQLLSLHTKWHKAPIWGEKGVIRKSCEPFLKRRARARRIYPRVDWITRTGDKEAMARGFQGRASMGKVFFPKNTWADRVINQLVGFPAGIYDDAVDTCATIGLVLDKVGKAYAPVRLSKKPELDRWAMLARREPESSWKTL